MPSVGELVINEVDQRAFGPASTGIGTQTPNALGRERRLRTASPSSQ
jgi:hypothetical protein